jgi:glycerol kinase
MNTGEERLKSQAGLLATAAWRLKGQTKTVYALEGGAFICGAAVQFLRDQLGFFKEASEIEKLAAKVSDSAGVEFVPALTGLGAPHWDPRARGMISGLTRGTTRAHIARATLEAMALQNADILVAMASDLTISGGKSGGENGGKVLKSVRVDGGASANSLLMQMQADFLGVEVVRPKIIETTSVGAAYLAGHGADLYESLDQIKSVWKIEKTFRPKLSPEAKNERMASWQDAIRRVKMVSNYQ